MRRGLFIVIAAWLAAGRAMAALPDEPAPLPTPSPISAVQTAHDALVKADAYARSGDYRQAATSLDAMMKSDAFAQMGEGDRHLAYRLLGFLRLRQQQAKDAEAALKVAANLSVADSADWLLLLQATMSAHDREGSATTLQTIARRWPADLSKVDDRLVGMVLSETPNLQAGRVRFFGLMSALDDAGWRPNDPILDFSQHWLIYVEMLQEKGEDARAKRAAQHVLDPLVIVAMRADKQFDAIVRADPDRFDVKQAMARELARLQALAAQEPDKLTRLIAVGAALTKNGRAAEALALYDGALARISNAAGGPAPFTDLDQYRDWFLNNRAYALFSLGRTDEGLAQLVRSARPEIGEPSIDQVLNLVVAYGDLGRPRQALDMLEEAPMKTASMQGVFVAGQAQLCALSQLTDPAALAKATDAVKAQFQAFNNSLPERVDLCLNDLDAAAAIDLTRLALPLTRGEFLQSIQEFSGHYLDVGPWADQLRARRRTVLSRPEIRAAIAKYGRIEHYDMVVF